MAKSTIARSRVVPKTSPPRMRGAEEEGGGRVMAARTKLTAAPTREARDRQMYRKLGAVGAIIWALPPVQRTFLREATGMAMLAATARESDRTAFVMLIDRAFDEIEQQQPERDANGGAGVMAADLRQPESRDGGGELG